jgi:GNAT superfamily N-acetyltransferase
MNGTGDENGPSAPAGCGWPAVGTVAAYAAAVAAFGYALVDLYWAVGGHALVSTVGGYAEQLARRGVATLLMDAAEQLARDRGIAALGITVGLFDEYGPAQRLYGRRGYIPDGRGACQGQRPLRKGTLVTMNDDLIIWLTKDLVS